MVYAPILIPTLCRYEHLKNCVVSLSENTGAEYTDLFIALDYPLAEKHWEGYNAICKYIDTIKGFASVNIIKRKTNYGAIRNFMDAQDSIFEKYDRIIYTDDDCVFSPNFLEFINIGLERFKNDKSVFAINGYNNYPEVKCEENNFYFQGIMCSPYGLGIWKDRVNEFRTRCTQMYCLKKLLNPLTCYKTLRRASYTFLFLVLGILKKVTTTDNTYSLFMFFEKKKVIMPIISKVKNMGWDGSGVNCRVDNTHSQREIDTSSTFTYTGTGQEYSEEINKLYSNGLYECMTKTEMLKILFKMIRHRVININKF